ncbi:hypothetical protein C7271_13350 [filamentous cyanobacterium CCP5]|nr:hypothetical protein C7271_13350 [filamentous cyanobacterium CCP5]
MSVAEDIAQEWRLRLQRDHPNQNADVLDSLIEWLIGEDKQRYEDLEASDLGIARRAIDYRYRILQQRYWDVSPERAYRQLIKRLSSLFLIRNKVGTWIALSRDRQRSVVDVIQEIIQEMLQSDRNLAQQLGWIASCTESPRLRNLLTLATIEEYCLRPIRNQPLIVYRFVNYLRRIQKGGMTQVPSSEKIRLISEEISGDNPDSTLSLLDFEAVSVYEEQQNLTEQQIARERVKTQFMNYLADTLDETAVDWLELYLKGYSQEAIAKRLGLPTRQVYRLREKVSYHAIKVFTLKEQPDLVFGWLKTSLKHHNFGLTPAEWEAFWQQRTDAERRLLTACKQLDSLEKAARQLNYKSTKQVQTLWAQLYLDAQAIRSQGDD